MILSKPSDGRAALAHRAIGVAIGLLLLSGACLGQTDRRQPWLTPESLGMPREKISHAMIAPALRVYSERGVASIRDMTVTGLSHLSFPPLVDYRYLFNLAFREESTGTLIQDAQDRGGDPLYYNLQPKSREKLGASRNEKDGWTWVLLSQDAHWQPNCYTRTGTFHKHRKGRLISFGVKSRTSISFEADEIYEELEIENRTDAPLALTLIPDQNANPREPCFVSINGKHQVAVVCDLGRADKDGWRMEIPAKGRKTAMVALLLGASDMKIPPGNYVSNLAARFEKSQEDARRKLQWASERMPRVETGNPARDAFYCRSILSVLCCRWDRENFCVRPFYEFGQRLGHSVAWDIAFTSEMLSVLDPEGLKNMLMAFFRAGVADSTYVRWSGWGGGDYAQHPCAILRILNDYIRQTGDVAVLDRVERGVSVFESMKRMGKQVRDKYARPDGLLDYGDKTTRLLELRTDGYAHVAAATNAMMADYYRQVALWCRERKDPEAAAFQAWADQLQNAVNAKLWNDREGWYGNLYPDGTLHVVLSYHMYDVLDGQTVPPERKRRLIERIKEGEFLGPYGMYSIARSDLAHWDREDCDFGGGGQYVGFPPQIAESLYRMNEKEKAWDVLSRCTHWVERFPHFPHTLYADHLALQLHQMHYPLEISSGAAAQAVIFGLFGLRPQSDGSMEVSPAYNATLGQKAKLSGYRFRGHVYDVELEPTRFHVWRDGQKAAEHAYGTTVSLPPAK